jgi:hypothetical protein
MTGAGAEAEHVVTRRSGKHVLKLQGSNMFKYFGPGPTSPIRCFNG